MGRRDEQTQNQNRVLFIRKLRANPGYIRLTSRPDYGPGRRERFEEYCWRCYCTALRNQLEGARARQALKQLQSLHTAIGDPSCLPREIVASLDKLQRDPKYCFDTADLKDAKAVLDELSR